jgi:hypothetical protein
MLLFIIIALLAFILQSLFAYWWLAAASAFVATILLGKGAWSSFFAGFFAIGLVWFGQAYFLNFRNEGLLLGKISELFSFSPIIIFVITVAIGALMAGFAALSGYSIKALFKKAA